MYAIFSFKKMISNSRNIISTVCSNNTYFTNIHVLMIIFCEIDSNKALFPSSEDIKFL